MSAATSPIHSIDLGLLHPGAMRLAARDQLLAAIRSDIERQAREMVTAGWASYESALADAALMWHVWIDMEVECAAELREAL